MQNNETSAIVAAIRDVDFMPVIADCQPDAMGERWEMVLNQNKRVSVWKFQNGDDGWFCVDYYDASECDSFEMDGWREVSWAHTGTSWVRDTANLMKLVAALVEHYAIDAPM